MGITYVEALVRGDTPRAAQERVRFLVDSGAMFSVLPQRAWKKIGLESKRKVQVELADGTLLSRPASECHFEYRGVEASSPVILGEAGDEALLGVLSLETLGLVFNPLKRTLRPMRIRM